MAAKIFVNYGDTVLSSEKSKAISQRIADALCVCPEDVLVLGGVQSISVVDVPDSMTKAYKKQEAKPEPKKEKEPEEPEEPKGPHETHYPKFSKGK